jgi:putative endonuclease
MMQDDNPLTPANYAYLLECADGTLYTGWTNDLEKRLSVHNAGQGSRYTRVRLPVKLVFYRAFDNKVEAMRFESRVKLLSRRQKEQLISGELSL